MKKLVLLLCLTLFSITLAACDQLQDVIDEVAPTLSGIEDVTIAVGDEFNVMDGVSSSDDVDGDITGQITYTITDEVGNPATIDLNVPGVYLIKYTIEDAFGNTITAERTLTIIEDSITVVVHLQVPTTEAQAILDQFYHDVFDETVSIQELCDMYIGDVPFPINNSDVAQCLEGIAEVRTQFIDYEIASTVLITDDTDSQNQIMVPVYRSEVTLQFADISTITGEVEFAVLALEGDTQGYIHFYGDPFLHDEGGNDISTETAREHLVGFYDSFFDVTYDVEDLCTDMAFPWENCPAIVSAARTLIGDYESIYVQTAPITYPDGTDGEGFRADILINIGGQPYEMQVFFFFVTDPDTGDIVHLEFLGPPLVDLTQPIYNVLDIPVLEAEAYLVVVYDDIFDMSLDVTQFCTDYIAMVPIEGPEINDCIEAVTQAREYAMSYVITNVVAATFDSDEQTTHGYIATIEFDTVDGPLIVDIEFIVVEFNGNVFAMLMTHPLGFDDQDGNELLDIAPEDASMYLDSFYLEMENQSLDLLTLCEGYVAGLPLDVSPVQCYEDLLPLRNSILSHDIIGISSQYFEEDGFYGTIYTAELNMVYLDDNPQITIQFGFVETEFGMKMIIMSNPMGEEPDPIETVTIPLNEAHTLLAILYADMLDINIPEDTVCTEYISHLPFEMPTHQECVELVSYMRNELAYLNVVTVNETVVDFDGVPMSAYLATIEYSSSDGLFTLDVVFFVIGSVDYPYIMFYGHPLGQDGTGGLDLVEVPLETAQLELAYFYDSIMDDLIDLTTFCASYMEGLPFPNDPDSITECANGLMNLRNGLESYVIIDITAIVLDMDGMSGPGYQATIQMFDIHGMFYEFPVQFGFIETEYGTKFIMLSNPGWGGDDLDLVEVPDPETHVESLMNTIFTEVDLLAVCEGYLASLPPFMSVDDCLNDFTMLKTDVQFVIHISTESQMIDQDGLYGTMYRSVFNFTHYDSNDYDRVVYYVFIEIDGESRLMVLNDIYGDEEMERNLISVTPLDAEFLLTVMYDKIFNPIVTSEDLCTEYIITDPYGPTYEECLDAITMMKANYTGYSFTDAVAMDVRIGEYQYIPGYMVEMTLLSIDETYTFELHFTVADDNFDEVYDLIFVGHPAGMDGGDGPDIYTPDVVEVGNIVTQMYNDLFDIDVDAATYCNTHILMNPMTMFDPTSCVDYVTVLRESPIFFTVDEVVEETIPAGDGTIPGYRVSLTFTHDGNVSESMDLLVAFIYGPDDMIIAVYFTDELVVGEAQGSMYADIGVIDAQNLIIQYYDALVDPNVPEAIFCQLYLPLNTDMSVMDPLDCEALKVLFEDPEYMFTVGTPVFFEALGDVVPPYYQVEITRMYGPETITYTTAFIFMLDQNGQVLPSTPMEQSLGLLYTPEPLSPYPIDSLDAQLMIEMYYLNLFDVTLPPEVFLSMYYDFYPDDMSLLLLEIEQARMLNLLNAYSVNLVTILNPEFSQFGVEIIEISPMGTIPLLAEFEILYGVDGVTPILIPMTPLLPGASLPVEMDPLAAFNFIETYYAELFNPLIPNEIFCDIYNMFNPFYEGTLEDCLNGRAYALSRPEIYTVMDVFPGMPEPYMTWEAIIHVDYGEGMTDLYELTFAIVYEGPNAHPILMDEIIRDIPLP